MADATILDGAAVVQMLNPGTSRTFQEYGERVFASYIFNKFKKDSLKKHATTVDHRAALESRSARRDMQRAIVALHLPKTLLGVDLVRDGAAIAADATEGDILRALAGGRPGAIVVTRIGVIGARKRPGRSLLL